jgi:hypothetical protein
MEGLLSVTFRIYFMGQVIGGRIVPVLSGVSESHERGGPAPDPLAGSGGPHESSPRGEPEAASAARIRRWRRRRPRVTRLSQEELDALPVRDRLDVLDKQRAARHQLLNSAGILFSVLFTAASLIATALTLRASQNELRTSQEGQITGRYIQATQQLGAAERDVRVSAIYALERIASDSPRDRPTISDVLAAFIREHDPAPATPDTKLAAEPDTDVTAAITVIGRLYLRSENTNPPDLHGIRTPGANLVDANLNRADLINARLNGAHMREIDLSGAKLTGVNLSGADLSNAILNPTDKLYGTKVSLYHANLYHANLTGAALINVDLRSADLRGANLAGAELRCANLFGARLDGADFSGADLRSSARPEQLRNVAKADERTKWGPDPRECH